ncbi:MAG: T9SS type A sorting domain-containing protein [Armatimonadetes bacterium]|nr:T9SS type A sorting domain-containing protein [Armatimonadota bacterium]
MKKIIIIFLTLVIHQTLLFSDYRITRGPEVGEIFFIGPTVTEPMAIYHSTDFGETVSCMDSTLNTNINFMSITADLTPGVLYGYSMPENLYRSYEYGEQGSWNFITNNGYWNISSGRNEGEIYNSIASHSEDYGTNFIQHSYNGFFGSLTYSEIDISDNVGYAKVSIYGMPDSTFLLITYDNFENLEIQNAYNISIFPLADLSRGTENGELYNFAGSPQTIFYSNDYGLSWQYINEFNYGLDYTDFVGGKQEGEVYVLVTYVALMHTIDHIYIFHSIDYGRTFTVYHSFSKGEEPLVANFSSSITEGITPFTVQFSNYSVGDIISYEWDFDNDGIVDSNELHPEFTYQDTGYYSVKLVIHDQDGSNEYLRENYIYVINGSETNDYELEITNYVLCNYPNPFNPETVIKFSIKNEGNVKLEIYNSKGQRVRTLVNEYLEPSYYSIIWDGKDNESKNVTSGIYFYKLKAGEFFEVKKMILLK